MAGATSAFNGDLATKAALMRRLIAHTAAHEVVSESSRWDGQKGAASGCLIHEADLAGWEACTGLPVALANVLDFIASALAPADAGAAFALYWLSIIEVGANLAGLPAALVAHLIGDPGNGVIRYAADGPSRDVARSVVALHERAARSDRPTTEEWRAARTVAMEVTDNCEGLAKLVGECVEASAWDVATAPAALNDVLVIWLRIKSSVSGGAFLENPIRASVKAKLDEIHPQFLELKAANPDARLDIFEYLEQRAPDYHALIRYNPHIGLVRDAVIGLTLST